MADILLPPRNEASLFSSINRGRASASASYSTAFSHPSGDARDRFLARLATSWSLIHNWPKLFTPVPENTQFLNGLRVFSMFYVILGHTTMFMLHFGPGIENFAWFFTRVRHSCNIKNLNGLID